MASDRRNETPFGAVHKINKNCELRRQLTAHRYLDYRNRLRLFIHSLEHEKIEAAPRSALQNEHECGIEHIHVEVKKEQVNVIRINTACFAEDGKNGGEITRTIMSEVWMIRAH